MANNFSYNDSDTTKSLAMTLSEAEAIASGQDRSFYKNVKSVSHFVARTVLAIRMYNQALAEGRAQIDTYKAELARRDLQVATPDPVDALRFINPAVIAKHMSVTLERIVKEAIDFNSRAKALQIALNKEYGRLGYSATKILNDDTIPLEIRRKFKNLLDTVTEAELASLAKNPIEDGEALGNAFLKNTQALALEAESNLDAEEETSTVPHPSELIFSAMDPDVVEEDPTTGAMEYGRETDGDTEKPSSSFADIFKK